jgi:hypothetical protein
VAGFRLAQIGVRVQFATGGQKAQRHFVSASEERVMRALGRVLRTWSLIKSVPLCSILPLQAPLLQLLSTRSNLPEDQLVVLGLKHLYSSLNQPKGDRPTVADLDIVETSETPNPAAPVQKR